MSSTGDDGDGGDGTATGDSAADQSLEQMMT